MSLQDLVNAATAAQLEADYRAAYAAALKAAAIGEAERLRADGVPIREMSSDQRLGALRLDGADLPAVPTVEKPDELASWLAEPGHAPDLITASVRVPVEDLEAVLEVLGYAQIPGVSARVESKDTAATARWLADHCVIQGDPQIRGAWNVLHRDAEGHLTPVPGVSAYQPAPQWKLIRNRDLAAERKTTAQQEVDGIVAELRGRSEADAVPA